MKKTDEEIQALSSSFYRTGRRDDGLWHLLRDADNVWWINGQVIAHGAFFTTPNILGILQIPTDAKGVILSCAFRSTVAQSYVHVCEGTRNPNPAADMPVGAANIVGFYCRQWVAVLFGITALVPDGTVRFGAFGPGAGVVTLFATPIGYIA